MCLSELQSVIGKVQRACMTLPAGARVFLTELLALSRGLHLPWHRRRMTQAARQDLRALADVLVANVGRGYFDTSHLPWAPGVFTDAMKDHNRAGWGWCTEDGRHDMGVYGSAQRHKHIDELEGDAVRRVARALGHDWAGKRVPIYIDNSAFQRSFAKGWSKARRLSVIIRDLYYLSARHDFIAVPRWISTTVNVGADALSRGDLQKYLEWARTRPTWTAAPVSRR